MGFRRKKENVKTEHQWKQFVSTQAVLIQEIGLPEWIIASHEYWQDVIYYGYPEQIQRVSTEFLPWFDVLGATPSELTGFVKLLQLYFEAGFAYSDPAFLKWRDRRAYDRIAERFAPTVNAPDERR